MPLIDQVKETYKKLFKEDPLMILSPGRINLIGEHTDYNDGFVLPAAIDKKVVLAIGPSGSDECKVYSETVNEISTFNLKDIYKKKGWVNYVLGVVDGLLKAGAELSGFNAVFDSNVPVGAGLSSSAALEGAFSFGLKELFDLEIDRTALAKIGQQAEHRFAGVQCGIMDQFANLYGKKDSLIKLDCRDLSFEYYPFHFPEYKIVLCNSMVHHSLADSEYNIRRKECEQAVEKLVNYYPGIQSLRDVTLGMLEAQKDNLTEVVYRRSHYVVSEIDRVERACEALKEEDLFEFGNLMFRTHVGLSEEYEVSCQELDYLVSLAGDREEVIGARMMGGGFGGCTINIVEKEKVHDFGRFVASKYEEKFHKEPEIYITNIEEGTHALS